MNLREHVGVKYSFICVWLMFLQVWVFGVYVHFSNYARADVFLGLCA